MDTTAVMLLCLAVVLVAKVSSIHGSPVMKRNADTPPHPADNDADNANQEENDAVEGRRNAAFIHVVAVNPGKYNRGVGYNENGEIDGEWKVDVKFGHIRFDEEKFLIEIEEDGFYRYYGQVTYLSNFPTSLPMKHCVGVIREGKMDNKGKQCATSAANYHYAENVTERYWGHSDTKITEGVRYMKKGDLVGMRMDTSALKPESGAIRFTPEGCFFGVERKA